ncbi:MAG TPA: DegQ family serine endoprotease, partial [Nitrospira sp.]|nr:DegQ family serine endoprotease [Nitrospira sp.]HND03399.1 DegQ family serine endoprotease [Nitrospira sp.]HNI19841.1 DegQ family serine endoprotease [Nitrospira sp.]HNM62745.1 DegQ family serine endoprotease [Nitrospira sp.]
TPFEDPFFRRFFGEEWMKRFEAPKERKQQGLGSGVIVDANGLIITNNHVVNKADEIKVFLSDKREFKAKLVGTDAKTDVAVLKIEATGLPTVAWADSDKLEVGEFVLAVGNPFGLTQTVTLGIVSALGRAAGIAEYEDFIQTDAAINPGNSGGALVNVRGELVGINTAIYSQSGGNMGIGFAVPSNMAHSIMDQLVQHGKVVRGWLGVSIQELTPELSSQFGVPKEVKGVLVSDIMDDSPAKKAGFERGDVIVEYDGKPMDSPAHLRNAVAQTVVGKKVTVKLIREKKPKSIDLVIAEQPKNLSQAAAEEGGESIAPAGLLADIEVREVNSELAGRYGLKSSDRGIVVVRVKPGSQAEEAGVREGDLVLEVNRKSVGTLKSYEHVAANLPKDQAVLLLLKRQGRAIYLTLRP